MGPGARPRLGAGPGAGRGGRAGSRGPGGGAGRLVFLAGQWLSLAVGLV